MKVQKSKFLTWRIKLILVIGCFGSLALWLSGNYVETMESHSPNSIPLSWTFKSTAANIPKFFRTEQHVVSVGEQWAPSQPEMDQTAHPSSRIALFALG